MALIELYTDGGFQKKPARGSYGFVVVHKGRILHKGKGTLDYDGVTSQRAEMTAIRLGLAYISEQCFPNESKVNVHVTSDSQYCVKSLSEWIFGWKKNGWVTSSGNDVKNLDLWQAIMPLAYDTFNKVSFEWVRGHNGHEYNEIADLLCNEALGRC